MLFSGKTMFGQTTLRQQVQKTPLCLGVSGSVRCVENRLRVMRGGRPRDAQHPGLVQNNLCGVAPSQAEYDARNAADIAWMQHAFDWPWGVTRLR